MDGGRRRRGMARAGQSGLGAAGLGFSLFLVVSGGITFFQNGRYESSLVEQPVIFNHRRHVEEEGLDCILCHKHYETETFSGFPPANLCALCHAEPQGETREEQRLVELLQAGDSLDWAPIFQQPPHVFYSHRLHVVVAGIECVTCHGGIGQSESPPTHGSPMTMDECLDCHHQENASTDCSSCHR